MDQLSTTQSNVTHLVVDVRRTDFEVSSKMLFYQQQAPSAFRTLKTTDTAADAALSGRTPLSEER